MGKITSIDFTIDSILKLSSDNTNNSDEYTFSECVLFNNGVHQSKEFINVLRKKMPQKV